MMWRGKMLASALATIGLTVMTAVFLAGGIYGRTGQVPMPAGVSLEAERAPADLLGATGGHSMGEEAAKGAATAAARAHSVAGCVRE